MLRPKELEALPATAPWLMHSLRTLFDARRPALHQEALRACTHPHDTLVQVKFIYRCMEVTAVYDSHEGCFVELRACDIAEVEWEQQTYCITMNLRPQTDQDIPPSRAVGHAQKPISGSTCQLPVFHAKSHLFAKER